MVTELNGKQAYDVIKNELKKYLIFDREGCKISVEGLTNKIFSKLHAYLKEEENYHKSKRTKRIVVYRVVTMVSGVLVIYILTGSVSLSIASTIVVNVVNTAIHYLVEYVW